MIIKSPQCTCPLCGGMMSYMTFSRLFRCTQCGQHFADDKAQYIHGGRQLLEYANTKKAKPTKDTNP